MKKEELKEFIEKYIGKRYFLGQHGSLKGIQVLDSIMNNGIDLRTSGNKYNGCVGVLMSNGRADNKEVDDALEYSYGAPIVYICAFPIELENSLGKKIFCGYSEKTRDGLPKDQKDYECLMTKICDLLGYIPVEFILAIKKIDIVNGNIEFYLNPRHYSGMSKEDRQKFFSDIIKKLKAEKDKNANNWSKSYDIENVLEMLDVMSSSLDNANIDFSLSYIRRILEQRKIYEKEEDEEEQSDLIKSILLDNSYSIDAEKNMGTVELKFGNMLETIEIDDNDVSMMEVKKKHSEKYSQIFFLTFDYGSKDSIEKTFQQVDKIKKNVSAYFIDKQGKATSRYTGIIGGIGLKDAQQAVELIKIYLKMGYKVKIGDKILNSITDLKDDQVMQLAEGLCLKNLNTEKNNGESEVPDL